MTKQVFICRFDAVSHLRGKQRTYKNIKEAVLAAGRFSVFDVETKKDGYIFTDLCHDPELEIDLSCGYPWVGVTKKATLC